MSLLYAQDICQHLQTELYSVSRQLPVSSPGQASEVMGEESTEQVGSGTSLLSMRRSDMSGKEMPQAEGCGLGTHEAGPSVCLPEAETSDFSWGKAVTEKKQGWTEEERIMSRHDGFSSLRALHAQGWRIVYVCVCVWGCVHVIVFYCCANTLGKPFKGENIYLGSRL